MGMDHLFTSLGYMRKQERAYLAAAMHAQIPHDVHAVVQAKAEVVNFKPAIPVSQHATAPNASPNPNVKPAVHAAISRPSQKPTVARSIPANHPALRNPVATPSGARATFITPAAQPVVDSRPALAAQHEATSSNTSGDVATSSIHDPTPAFDPVAVDASTPDAPNYGVSNTKTIVLLTALAIGAYFILKGK